MVFISTVIVFFIIIGLLVFVHEFGHFAAAKISKVPVKEFAIGFGPTLIGKKYKETHYQVKLIPLGGFVSLEGEEESTDPNGFRNQPYRNKAMILLGGVFMNVVTTVLLLGLYMIVNDHRLVLPNLSEHEFSNTESTKELYPVGITGIDPVYSWEGIEETETLFAIVGTEFRSLKEFSDYILENSPKQVEVTFVDLQSGVIYKKDIKLGALYDDKYFVLTIENFLENARTREQLEEGLNIVAIDGKSFSNFKQFLSILSEYAGKEDIEFTFVDFETGEYSTKNLDVPVKNEETGTILDAALGQNYGIGFVEMLDITENMFTRYEFKSSVFTPITLTWDLTVYQLDGLVNIISDSIKTGDYSTVSQSFGGPVAVGTSVNQIIELGNFGFLIFLTALISLSLAIFNILPIPALDGGQLFIVTIERIRRKNFSDRTVRTINTVGFIALITLSVIILIKDIAQFEIIQGIGNIFSNILGR